MIAIRRAVKEDIPGINKLLRQVLEIHAGIRPDIFKSGTVKYTDEQLSAIIADPHTPVFVGEEEDRIIAHCFTVFKKESANNLIPARELYIDDLCVEADRRGEHIGTAMFEYTAAFAKANGCKRLCLNVWQGNEEAAAFYRRMGFTARKTMMEMKL